MLLSIRTFSRLTIAALFALTFPGCAGDGGQTPTTTSQDLNGLSMQTGHYARTGGPTPGVLTDLVLKDDRQFEASGYAPVFWGPADEESPIAFSGSYTIKDDTLTLLTHKGNPYDTYVVHASGSRFDFSYTSERGDPIAFTMTYADDGDTLPTQPSKDPGMPPALSGGQQLRCGGMFGTTFSLTRSGGFMYTFAGEPKVVDHIRLSQSDAEASDSSWLRLTGSGTKGRDGHNDYEVNVPAAAFRAGATNVTIDVSVGSEDSGVFVAMPVTCDAVN